MIEKNEGGTELTYSLSWLPKVLRDAGLSVVEQPNWQTRGHGDVGRIIGVICHHTAGGKGGGNLPSLGTITKGRPGLAGPLCNLGLGRDGTFYMVGAGKGWHAGQGSWKGVRDGNSHFVGIEAENSGYLNGPNAELWPAPQVDAYARGCAAILDYIKQPVTQCIGHKEWAPHRKTDPTFAMDQFRDAVHFYMDNPKGSWRGTLDRMAARLTIPTHNHDGCNCDVGKVDSSVPTA